jgi:putative transposase
VEILQTKGATLEEAARKMGIGLSTLSRWKRNYAGMDVAQAKRLKELELENSRLKRLVADKELDILILNEVAKGKF